MSCHARFILFLLYGTVDKLKEVISDSSFIGFVERASGKFIHSLAGSYKRLLAVILGVTASGTLFFGHTSG